MIDDIHSYLQDLQAALTGADPALVQDALFDAEEYLQAEMAAGADLVTAVENYGAPEEVAAAYLGTPVTTRTEANSDAIMVDGSVPSEEAEAAAAGEPQVTAQAVPSAGQTARSSTQGVPVPPVAPPAGVQAGLAAAANSSPASPSVWRQIFGVFVDARVYKSLLYMVLSLVTGIAYFTIVVTGLSTAAGLLVLVIGIPFLLLVLGVVRGLALLEGRLVEVLLGTRMPRRPRAEPPNAGFIQRIWFWIKDGRTWASMAYMLLMLPLGIAYFSIAVTGVAVGVGLVTTPAWYWIGPYSVTHGDVTHTVWFHLWLTPFAMIGGFLLLLAWFHIVRWIGRGHAAFAKAMLVRLAK